MTRYIALLRGVNVGGKAKLKMADLQAALSKAGLEQVRTYIQSGNVVFGSALNDTKKLGQQIEHIIRDAFELEVAVVVFSRTEWRTIIDAAPKWWGIEEGWRHNIMVLLKPYDITPVEKLITKLDPSLELIEIGNGVIYQSNDLQKSGPGRITQLLAFPIYKRMTIRNYNTATKLLKLLED